MAENAAEPLGCLRYVHPEQKKTDLREDLAQLVSQYKLIQYCIHMTSTVESPNLCIGRTTVWYERLQRNMARHYCMRRFIIIRGSLWHEAAAIRRSSLARSYCLTTGLFFVQFVLVFLIFQNKNTINVPNSLEPDHT